MSTDSDIRKCPVCKIQLDEKPMHTEMVDQCPLCLGVFFDRMELDSIIQIAEFFNQTRLDEDEIDTIPEKEKGRMLICPHEGSGMKKRDLGGQIIDVCETCEGIWLDNSELWSIKMVESHIRENLELYIRLGN
ncbi:zf-TFIIB domain-containing protein [Candidatus Riflebacteria bacterium]